MAAPLPDPTPVNAALRRLHRSTIASLFLCAVGIGIATLSRESAPAGEIEGAYSWVALVLAATAILTRRTGIAPRTSLRSFIYASLASLVAAAGLGMLGLLVALKESQNTVGLLYTLAGALLVLRPPAMLGGSASGSGPGPPSGDA